MTLQELKQQIEGQWPGEGRIKALGFDKLPAGFRAVDPQAKNVPPVEALRLNQLVDLLERANPEYVANINSVRVHPNWQNSYYGDNQVDLGLRMRKEAMSPSDIIASLIHEITHSITPYEQLPQYIDPTVHKLLLGQPGGKDVPALAGSGYNPSHHSKEDEIAPNVMGWALSRYLFPENPPTRLHPEGYKPAANEVARILQLENFVRDLKENGLQ